MSTPKVTLPSRTKRRKQLSEICNEKPGREDGLFVCAPSIRRPREREDPQPQVLAIERCCGPSVVQHWQLWFWVLAKAGTPGSAPSRRHGVRIDFVLGKLGQHGVDPFLFLHTEVQHLLLVAQIELTGQRHSGAVGSDLV